MRLPIPPVEAVTSRQVAAQSQRDRLHFAVMTVVAERGYAATTVADVIAAAGVSRRTFYEHFANIEACFLAAYDLGATRLDEIVSEAVASVPAGAGWLAAVRSALRVYFETFAAQPAFATAAMVEILGAGPIARAHYLANVARFEALLRQFADLISAAEGAPRAADTAITLISGGLARFVIVETLADRAEQLPDRTDEMVDILVSILLGRTPIPNP